MIKETLRTTCVADIACFPPFDIELHKTGDEKGNITLRFPPSNRHDLTVTLVLLVRVAVSAHPETIIELASSAVASLNSKVDMEATDSSLQVFFRGQHEHTIIKRSIERLLLSMLDKGQDLTEDSLTGTRLGRADNTLGLLLWDQSN